MTKIYETIADIAYIAGQKGYSTGESRTDIATIVKWAEEFEKKHESTVWGEDLDYMEEVFNYAEQCILK